jgi:hypothetical protein
MKKNLFMACLAIAFAATFLTACKKGNNSSPKSSTVNLAFGVTTDSAPASLPSAFPGSTASFASAAASTVVFTSGIANVTAFKLEATKHGVETEISSKNLSNIDLFAVVKSLTTTTIDTGIYTKVELRVLLSKSATSNIPLTLKGTFTSSTGTTTPIELDFNEDVIIKAEVENVIIDGTEDLTNMVTFHLNKLLTNVGSAILSNATLTGNTLVISSTSNTAIYNAIKANINLLASANGFEKHLRDQ